MRLVMVLALLCLPAIPSWRSKESVDLEQTYKRFRKMADMFLEAVDAQRAVAGQVAAEFKKPWLDKDKLGDLMYEYDCKSYVIVSDADHIVEFGESVMKKLDLEYGRGWLRRETYDKAVKHIEEVVKRAREAKAYRPEAITRAQAERH